MTSEAFGEKFEGDFADMCAEKFLLMTIWASVGSSVRRPGSEDPHRREQNLYCFDGLHHKVYISIVLLFGDDP